MLSPFFIIKPENQMSKMIFKYLFIIFLFFVGQNLLQSQQSDGEEVEEYYEDEYEYATV